MIIGNAGAGKSTLARALADKLKLPLFHLDKLFWLPGWKGIDKQVMKEKIEKITDEDEWIIDGNFRSTIKLLGERADTIIYINVSTILCLYRVVKRRYSGKVRTDIAEGCTENLRLDFLKPVIFYKSRTAPDVRKLLNSLPAEKKIIELKSRKEVNEFLKEIKVTY